MATIARASIDAPAGAALWDAVAGCIRSWAADEHVPLRDVVVLVPFVQLLPPARRAFAAAGGWMPRIETTRTLSASLGPAPPRGPGELGWGMANGTLLAMQQLALRPWAGEWSRRDPRGFAQGAARVVATAHALLAAAAAVAPEERGSWWHGARELVLAEGGPGGKEQLLAQVAIEWAARSSTAATDRLFFIRPAAWAAVVAGGIDPLVQSLLESAAAPALRVETDVDPAAPFRDHPAAAPALHVADGFEDEAAAAAAQVLAHLARGETPVALIAQDRALVRRIRALLEPSGAVVRDETGWRLSTTRAGAAVMALLAAARRDASADAWLDWLKGAPLGAARSAALEALEAALRRSQVADAARLARLQLDPSAAALRDDAVRIVDALARPARRSLAEWLDALAAALDACGALAALRADAAGRQALSALGIDPPLAAARRAQLGADLEPMTIAEVTRWVDDVFERETFLPPEALDDDSAPLPAEVVITPLARAMLRPFAAAVLPGTDDRRLGAMGVPDSLLPTRAVHALGIAGPVAEREAELLSFAQVLRLPRITLMRRRTDGAEPLANSDFVDWLGLALSERSLSWRPWQDPRIEQAIAPAPIFRSAPSIGAERVPRKLSQSAVEALRACPYRFFALGVLGLRAADELDDEVEKRDYGKWLHEVLHAFHLQRKPGADAAADAALLRAVGAASRASQSLDAAAFLPYSASFEVLVPRYVEWLHAREAAGASWLEGEVELRVAPEALSGVELEGRIDRIDVVDGGRGVELIDYKTGSSQRIKELVRDRFEDTQLAFYASLMAARGEMPLRASYLLLDATKGLATVDHSEVSESAEALLRGLADDLQRLRAGAALRPLGEGAACEYCDARGLCRRDHWSAAAAADDAEQR